MQHRNILDTRKPIIALLHLDALPGDPHFSGSIDKVIDDAYSDMMKLQNGNVDGILFSNEFSFPYEGVLSHVTTDSMAFILGALRRDLTVPFGVQAISDNDATIDLACSVGADFVRGVFTGAYIGEGGFFSTNIAKNTRRAFSLGREDLQMFFMANAESDADLSGRSIETIISSIIFRCTPSGICLSGMHAGLEADSSLMERMRTVSKGVPIFANTGCCKANIIDKLKICDGAFVGTGFKLHGQFSEHVDEDTVRSFMDEVQTYRNSLD